LVSEEQAGDEGAHEGQQEKAKGGLGCVQGLAGLQSLRDDTPLGVIIDFHHVDRTDKQSVHFLVKNYQFAAAMEEIKKCIPLCSNCHRILHWEERETYKREKKRKKALKGAKKA
jgi:hypothetical protein